MTAWNPLATDTLLLGDAWERQDCHPLSFWDSLVVAAARHLECGHLLTEDLQDGQSLDGVTVVNPFLHPVESIVPLRHAYLGSASSQQFTLLEVSLDSSTIFRDAWNTVVSECDFEHVHYPRRAQA